MFDINYSSLFSSPGKPYLVTNATPQELNSRQKAAEKDLMQDFHSEIENFKVPDFEKLFEKLENLKNPEAREALKAFDLQKLLDPLRFSLLDLCYFIDDAVKQLVPGNASDYKHMTDDGYYYLSKSRVPEAPDFIRYQAYSSDQENCLEAVLKAGPEGKDCKSITVAHGTNELILRFDSAANLEKINYGFDLHRAQPSGTASDNVVVPLRTPADADGPQEYIDLAPILLNEDRPVTSSGQK